MTLSAPNDLTISRFFVLHTPVTSAPKYLAICTAVTPVLPEAPYINILVPFWMFAFLRIFRTVIPELGIVAASSNVILVGFKASTLFSGIQLYSAYPPNFDHKVEAKT